MMDEVDTRWHKEREAFVTKVLCYISYPTPAVTGRKLPSHPASATTQRAYNPSRPIGSQQASSMFAGESEIADLWW